MLDLPIRGSLVARASGSVGLAALAAGLLAAAPASAQDGPESTSRGAAPEDIAAETAEPDGGLGAIVVTARRIEENLQDVPVAVTVQTGEQLVRQDARTVLDIARFTPGLFLREGSSTPSALSISMRGQVQTDILITLDPSVGTYVDDVYWARAYGLNAELLDVANVQVLKGPQGTLFGRNTTGGAVLFKTNDPDLSNFGGKASVTFGRFDYRVGELILNVPIIADVLGVRAAGRVSKRDGWIKNFALASAPVDVGRRFGEIDDQSYRLKVLVRPTDTLSVLLSGDYYKTDADGLARILAYATPADISSLPAMTPDVAALVPAAVAAGCATCVTNYLGTYGSVFGSAVTGGDPTAVLAANPALTTAYNRGILDLGAARLRDLQTQQLSHPFGVSNDGPNHVETETKTVSMIATLEAPFGQIKAVGAWREIASDTVFDLDGTPFPIHVTSGNQSVTQYSGELQATGTAFNDFIDFAAGVFYFHEKGFDGSISPRGPLSFVNQAGVRTNFAAATTNVSYANGTIDNDSMGAYLQADFHITDRLNITAGVRYSVDDKALINRNGIIDLVRAGIVTTDANGIAIAQRYSEGVNPSNFRDLTNFYVQNAAGAVTGCNFLPTCAFTSKASFSGWSYTIGADYKVTDDIMVYVKNGKGFRSGGHNLRATIPTVAIPFKPEVAYTTEVGIKSEFFDNRVRFNAAAYRTRVNNLQRSTLFLVNGSPITFLGNAASARITGMEADLSVAPIEGLTFVGTVALTDPEYINYQEVPSRTNLTGDRACCETFESVPKTTFSLQGSYEFRVGNAGKLLLSTNYNWVSEVKLVSGNFFVGNPFTVIVDPFNGMTVGDSTTDRGTADPIGLLGASIAYTFDDRYTIRAWGRNLTNESGITTATNAQLGYMNAGLREPRTYGLTLSAEF